MLSVSSETKKSKIKLNSYRIPKIGDPVAIIGLGVILPGGAFDIEKYWDNIKTGKSSIKEVSKERWDPILFYDPDPNVPDKTYSKIGGFIDNYPFNSLEFRIPPKIADKIDAVQKMALAAAKQALQEAGYKDGLLKTENTGVIVGNSMGGEIVKEYTRRIYFPKVALSIQESKEFQKLSKTQQSKLLEEAKENYLASLPEITEDSMPGELSNVIAGRIANVFNLRGKNITTDAACASSIAAIDMAYKSLTTGELDAVICGGSDRSNEVTSFVKFSKIGALSPDGSRPFDENANGFVMGEGAAFFVLKRLDDAIKSENKIYAIIRGIGSSSDGKGKGITAPNPIGQELAIRRALQNSGVESNEISLIEAHGTSTAVGDPVEFNTLQNIYNGTSIAKQSIALGSIKSQIGHLKSAAGAAAVVKIALSLYNKTLPPSINFVTPNSKIDWENSAFYVNTKAKPWTNNFDHPRKAGISSFGFGGTNFHVILEEYDPINYSYEEPSSDSITWDDYINSTKGLHGEVFFFSSPSPKGLHENLNKAKMLNPGESICDDLEADTILEIRNELKCEPSYSQYKVAIDVQHPENLNSALKTAMKVIDNPKLQKGAQLKGVFYSDTVSTGKIAFLFPGQGSQYVNMLLDLHKKYKVVKDTFQEADEVLAKFLNKKLSDYIFADNPEDIEGKEDALKQTEITQPAMLVADIALYRLLSEFGIKPDLVAGHSLGEFAALVVAEVLSFQDALMAVAIRGKAMGQVDSKDKGSMASVSGELITIENILKTEIKGYAIVANKNSTKRTVISGSTSGIDEAVKVFKKKGMNPVILNVSAAFHSKIVAPAAKKLAEFLQKIEFKVPKIKVLSNVTGTTYPDNPEAIRNLLEKQLASPVEWINQIKVMHEEGATLFFEVGPKRALTSFVSEILQDHKQVVAIPVNHPKKGDIKNLNEAIATAFSQNLLVTLENVNYTKLFNSSSRITVNFAQKPIVKAKPETAFVDSASDLQYMNGDRLLKEFIKSQGSTLKNWLNDSYQTFRQSSGKSTSIEDLVFRYGINFDRICVTGAGVGLPGKHKEIFDSNNIERIFSGENLIDPLSKQALMNQTDKNIRKLVKSSSGMASFQEINSTSQVIKLAGQPGKFDFVQEYQLAEKLISAYDVSTKLAIAAGLEALKDAGIPLIREYPRTSKGTYLPGDWVLPKELRENTGVIFASAFPGLNALAEELSSYYTNKEAEALIRVLRSVYGEIARREKTNENQRILTFLEDELQRVESEKPDYKFHPKFLLRVLPMAHSQFAQLIKAYGPNTQLNAACASTTQAVGMGEDWIRSGRCNRVIIIAGDDVSNEKMFEWMGAGFLISGASTIEGEVSKAALPFDRRRNGMIVGMGAVGLVIETEAESRRRGVKPIVEVLGSHFANSGFHGTRLDVAHISLEMNKFLDNVWRRHGISRNQIAESCMFMSHETYTPARGGSSIAEMESLKSTFGKSASKIIISNTKGFTGHPMGAGIEEVIAIKSLEHGKIPPIANFKEPDENLGNLRLSTGNDKPVNYAFRIGAGFGSQLAFTLYKKASSGERKTSEYNSWLKSFGASVDDLTMIGKTLRVKDTGSNLQPDMEDFSSKQPTTSKLAPPAIKAPKQINIDTVSKQSHLSEKPDVSIHKLLSELSGFPEELLSPEIKIQQDLGISLSELLENLQMHKFSLSQADLTDTLTLSQLSTLLEKQKTVDISQASGSTSQKSIPRERGYQVDKGEVLKKIIKVTAKETQYPPDFLDITLDMEADLGIDTVKQAEIFGLIREEYGITFNEDFDLSKYTTIEKIADFVIDTLNKKSTTSQEVAVPPEIVTEKEQTDVGIKSTEIKELGAKQSFSAPSKEKVIDQITTIISKQTDYPRSYLDIDLDLESDLGIDTVKQAELFGIIRETYNIEFQDDLDLSIYNTISKMADFVLTNYPTNLQPSKLDSKQDLQPHQLEKPGSKDLQFPATSTIPPLVSQSNTPGHAEVLKKVVEVICERTGYEEEFLDVDLDLESDLGIDTVKQAELMGEIREFYEIPFQEDLDLSKVNTINRIITFILSNLNIAKPEPVEQKQTTVTTQSKNLPKLGEDSEFVTYATKAISKLTGYPVSMITLDRNLAQDFGVPDESIDELATSLFLNQGISRPKGFIVKPILNDLLKSILTAQINKPEIHTTVRYVLTSFENSAYIRDKLGKTVLVCSTKQNAFWKNLNVLQVKNMKELEDLGLTEKFSLIFTNPTTSIGKISEIFKVLQANLTMLNRVILVVKAIQPSLHSMTGFQGAIGGMLKALDMEFETINAKIIVTDFKNKEQIKQEFENLSDLEVIIEGGSRRTIGLQPEPLVKKPEKLTGTILVSGGGQGITFQCIKALVNEGTKVGIIGRTKIRDDALEISQLNPSEIDSKKRELFAQMKESGKRVTPVLLEKEWAKYTKSATVYRSIQELQGLGAKVAYHSADVRDKLEVARAIKSLLQDLSSLEFTHLIHGAGIEISRPTKSKSLDEFELVYDVKTKGFANLLATVNKSKIKRIIAFGSVAGRFGNATQIDYSAANEFLAKEVQKHRNSGINASVIDWSAWAEVGMATNSTTQKILAAAGVTQISLNAGVDHFVTEFIHGNEVEVVIAGELGLLARKSTILPKNQKSDGVNKKELRSKKKSVTPTQKKQETKFKKPNDEDTVSSNMSISEQVENYPMIDEIVQNDKKLKILRTLTLQKDLYLDHHRIDGKAVLPGVMGLEFMAELMALLEKPVSEILDVELSSPVKLPRDRPLEIFAITDYAKDNYQKINLKSKFTTSTGQQLGDLRQHFSASFFTNSRQPSLKGLSDKELEWLRPKHALLLKKQIYEVFFHGPRFQVLENVLNLGENSIACKYLLPEQQLFSQKRNFEIAPLVIEACFQTAGLFDLLKNKRMSLPSSIKQLKLSQGAEHATFIYATRIRESETYSFYHVQALDSNGNIVLEIFEYAMIHTSKVDVTLDYQINKELDLSEIRFFLGNLTQSGIVTSINALKSVTPEFIKYILSEPEQRKLKSFKIEKRRLDWLAGVLSAKKAVSLAHNIPEAEITIQKEQDGKPFGSYQDAKFPVTISHSSGIAIGLSTTNKNIAADLERIEPKSQSFIKTSFTPIERENLSITPDAPAFVTLLWTIKETAFKFDGTGIKDNLQKTEIFGDQTSGFKIKTPSGTKYPKTMNSKNWALTVIKS